MAPVFGRFSVPPHGTQVALHPGVHWPIQALEVQRRFAPAFCPRRTCSQHSIRGRRRFRYSRHGFDRRKDGRCFRRYRCTTCESTFSRRAFSVSYYLKRPELLAPVAAGLVNGAAHRQIARLLGCAPSTVTRLAPRLGRHALLLQAFALRHLADRDTEDTVLDHFETFEGSQHDPVAVATLVGRSSWFVYGIDGCTHARTGHRSPFQERLRRLRRARDPRGGFRGSAARLLALRLQSAPDGVKVRLVSDDHPAYRRALRDPDLRDRFRHLVFPNPERGPKGSPRSVGARTRDDAMFANDLLHSLARHCLAHHHRETIAFPRRAVAALERLSLFAAWRNFIKGVSERLPDPTTPAMRKGLAREPWNWPRLLARRLFPDRVPLSDSWAEIYRRDWITPALPANTRHRLTLAY